MGFVMFCVEVELRIFFPVSFMGVAWVCLVCVGKCTRVWSSLSSAINRTTFLHRSAAIT